VKVCPACGEENPDRARVCMICATPLAEPAPAPEPARRVVTVFFCDVCGSTALGERLDPEAVRGLMNRYFACVSRALERHGGTVEKFIGDAVMALFGVPRVREDDALRAVRAAVEARDAVRALGDEVERERGVRLDARIGLATGEVVVGDAVARQTVATGDTVNVAARLEAAAAPREILIGASTYALVRDAVVAEPAPPLALKGKSTPVAAYRLEAVRAGATAGRRRRDDVPLIGREREVTLLREAFERVARERSCQLFTLLGTAGVGKSRLVAEVVAGLGGDARVIGGRCLSYGEGITYWPLAEAVRGAAGVVEGDAPAAAREKLRALVAGVDGDAVAAGVGSLIGLEGAGASLAEAQWAVRRLFEELAGAGRLTVVFDDLQWAEPEFLDLVDYLADWLGEAPVLLLCMARPELLDERPGWAGGKLNATTVLLEPLDDEGCAALLAAAAGAQVPPELVRRIADASGGNPLFAEELLELLLEDGHVRRGEGRLELVAPLDEVPMPATIQSLLAARLDRLNPDERGVVERASIEGQVFHVGTVEELGADPQRSRPTIQILARKQLLRSDRASLPGQDAFRFRHLLIREAAYDGIAKDVRARWHEAFADWLERMAGERLSEYEELLAHHVAQAARYRADVGRSDEYTSALARRAKTLYRAAADRALVRGDDGAADALLAQLANVAPAGGPEHALALLDRAVLAVQRDDARPAAERAAAALTAARAGGEVAELVPLAEATDVLARFMGDPTVAPDAAAEGVERAATELERAGRDAAATRAWLLVGSFRLLQLRAGPQREAGELALACARRAGARWLELRAIQQMRSAIVNGPGAIDELLARGEALLDLQREQRWHVAMTTANLAVLHAQQGAIDRARRDVDAAARFFRELGSPSGLYVCMWTAGEIALADGDADGAVGVFGMLLEATLRSEATSYASTAAGYLARAAALAGHTARAAREAARARRLAAPSDLLSQILWRSGAALAAEAPNGDAARLAAEAVELARTSDWPLPLTNALLDLARVEGATGDAGAARAAAGEARALSEERGARALVGQADAVLAAIAANGGRDRPPAA
jgi:class 3 adenylate cyclase